MSEAASRAGKRKKRLSLLLIFLLILGALGVPLAFYATANRLLGTEVISLTGTGAVSALILIMVCAILAKELVRK